MTTRTKTLGVAAAVAAIAVSIPTAVTAYADPQDRVRALTAGYQLHVSKPVDAASVASAIATLLHPWDGAPKLTPTMS